MSKFIFIVCIFFINILFSEVYVAYDTLSSGNYGGGCYFRQRMGNQLLVLFRAYRFARCFDATLVLMPLDIDIKNALNRKVKYIEYPEFYKIKKLKKLKSLSKDQDVNEDALFFSPQKYSQPKLGEILTTSYRHEFRDILKESCPGYVPYDKSGQITIAVHIRNGGGVDYSLYSKQIYDEEYLSKQIITKKFPVKQSKQFLDKAYPTKAPPLQFYIDSMIYFLENVSQKAKFVVFTDYQDKEELLELLKDNITYPVEIEIYQSPQEDEFLRDLNDILVMSSLDGIIRPSQSTFSMFALYLGDHKYFIHPINYLWYGDCLVMNRICYRQNRKETILRFYD